jgi:protein N-terminal methyltransferase
VCNIVDIVEPIEKFTDVMKDSKEWSILRETGRLGQIYNIGLQDWIPQASYDLMWNQWCVGHLTDIELVEHLKRCKHSLNPRGWIVVKENLSSDPGDTFDEIDSSVTRWEEIEPSIKIGKLIEIKRTHDTFLRVFEMAGLQLGATEVQKGMPHGLYQVRSYALQ